MFAENIFRPLPVSSYVYEGEENSEMTWEFQQTNAVYNAFNAFLWIKCFESAKASEFIDKRFVNALVQRLDSCLDAERSMVKELMTTMFCVTRYLREDLLNAIVDMLTDFGYGFIKEFKGIDVLLCLLRDFIECALVPENVLTKVLPVLIKHTSLCNYQDAIHECLESAVKSHTALATHCMDCVLKNWPANGDSKVDITLLASLFCLYECCEPEQWSSVQSRMIHQLSRLVRSKNAMLCLQAEKFIGRIIVDGRVPRLGTSVGKLADSLLDVYNNHWSLDCVTVACDHLKRLLKFRFLDMRQTSVTTEALGEVRQQKMFDELVTKKNIGLVKSRPKIPKVSVVIS
ncbi:uncharacterized protein LOC126845437 [Adelges cooleyi]|uniref:uncharacterized protein LOC126845437 n=1 Tax=Adelges cooleyi TaxID=133065 RepID=UPI00217F9474|nr:uncharacterized protein LOC126845437 [Adelges cooleyi]